MSKKNDDAGNQDRDEDFGKNIVFVLQETYKDETCNTGVYKSGEAMIEGLAESVADIFFADKYSGKQEPSDEEKELARAVALAVYDFMKLPCVPASRADECRFSETRFGFETMEVVESARDKGGK